MIAMIASKHLWPVLSMVALAVVTLLTWSWGLSLSYEDVPEARDSLGELRKVDPNTSIRFVPGSEGRWLLADGFEEPEEDGAWVSSLRARVVFEVSSDVMATGLVLTVIPLLAPELPTRRVTISSSSDRQTVELLGGGQSVLVALDGLPSQEIIIACESIDSPLDLGIGADKRQLCVKATEMIVMTEANSGEKDD